MLILNLTCLKILKPDQFHSFLPEINYQLRWSKQNQTGFKAFQKLRINLTGLYPSGSKNSLTFQGHSRIQHYKNYWNIILVNVKTKISVLSSIQCTYPGCFHIQGYKADMNLLHLLRSHLKMSIYDLKVPLPITARFASKYMTVPLHTNLVWIIWMFLNSLHRTCICLTLFLYTEKNIWLINQTGATITGPYITTQLFNSFKCILFSIFLIAQMLM